VALNLGKLYLLISGKSEPLKKELDKAHGMVRTGATKMQRTISNSFRMAFSLPGLLAGAGGISLLKSMNDAASDLEEVASKFDTVFGSLRGRANIWVDELTESFAMSEREARHYLSSMQDLLEPMGMNADAAADMSNEVVRLAADLGSFNNLRTEDVMRDIQSALVGNFETMKKYGVVLNQTVIEQEALRSGIISNKKELDASTRAQVAYNLILRGSKNAIGDLARTMGSNANQAKQLRANYEDVRAELGKNLLPITTRYIKELNEWIKANGKLFEQDIPRYIENTGEALQKIVDIYNLIPSQITSAAGWGIVGTALFGGKAGKIIGLLALTNSAMDDLGMGLGDLVQDSIEFWAAMNNIGDEMLRMVGLMDRVQEVSTRKSGEKTWSEIEAENLRNYSEFLEKSKEKIKQTEAERLAALKKEQDAYIAMQPVLKTYRDSWEIKDERTFTDEQIDKINQLKTEYIDALPIIKTFRDSWEVKADRTFTDEQIEKIKELKKGYNDTYADILESTRALTDNMSDAFTDFVMTGKLSFKDLVNSILRDLVSIQSNRIFTNIFSNFPSLFGFGASATGSRADVMGQHGAYLGEGVVGFGRQSGKSYEFHPNEYVMPSDKMRGGAPNVEVNVVNNLGVEADVQQTTNQIDPNRVITEIILNEKMHSRAFRRGLRG